MSRFVISVVILTVVYAVPSSCSAIIIYDDGGTHEITSVITDFARVDGNTTVIVNSGGVFERGLTAIDNSKVFVNNGFLYGLWTGGTSNTIISDGEIGHSLSVVEYSHMTVNGGILDGPIEVRSWGNLSITGGTLISIRAIENSNISISGGSLSFGLSAFEDTQVTISGGLLQDRILAADNSQFTISGTNFNYDYGVLKSQTGRLIGTLSNGDPMDIHFGVYGNATIVLIPEPATVLLFAIGAALLRGRRRI